MTKSCDGSADARGPGSNWLCSTSVLAAMFPLAEPFATVIKAGSTSRGSELLLHS